MTEKATVGIAAIVKNEAPYIVEWLAHHRLLGVDRFFIADNDSTDGTTELLQALEECGYIQLIRYPTQPGVKPQIPAYLELMARFGDQVEWLGFIDVDEFIWPTGNESSFADHLRAATSQNPMVGAIVLNWATYGSSKQARYSPEPVTQRFTWRARKQHPLNHNQKFFVRPKAFASFDGPHHCSLLHGYQLAQINITPYKPKADANYAMSENVIWEPFRLNHYIIKSYEEYVYKKASRGHAHSSYPLDRMFFVDRDENEEMDTVSEEYLHSLSAEVNRIIEPIDSANIIKSIQLQTSPSPLRTTNDLLELPVIGCIDQWKHENCEIEIHGWALIWKQEAASSIEVKIDKRWRRVDDFKAQPRPDVIKHYPLASVTCGFSAKFHMDAQEISSEIQCRAVSDKGIPTEALGTFFHNPKESPQNIPNQETSEPNITHHTERKRT